MRNFVNTNEVFPILEMIKREINKNEFNNKRVFMDEQGEFDGDPDEVTSVEVFRGGNTYDPDSIDSVIVTYGDGSTESILLTRGVTPPVPNTVPDYLYINNVLLTGFVVNIERGGQSKLVTGDVVRENGYGRITKLNLSYG